MSETDTIPKSSSSSPEGSEAEGRDFQPAAQLRLELFSYSDYRIFLRDFYQNQKLKNPAYSFRVFARMAKLKSPNYLKLVMDGTRRITDQTLDAFVRGLGLEGREAQFFRFMVLFQEVRDEEAKKLYHREMLQIKEASLTQFSQPIPEADAQSKLAP